MRKKFNLKSTILGIIIGGIIFGSIGITANYLLRAEDVEYVDKDNNLVTVQSAITDLYSKASSGGYGELALGVAEASGNSISVSYGDNYIGSACIYGTSPNNYTNVGKIVDNKCVMENLSPTTMYHYKVGVLDSSIKLYIGTGQKETASITYLSVPIEVYFNPVTNVKCTDYTEANSATGNSEGCMKWYVYAMEENYYTMILDHNTTAQAYYNYTNNNSDKGYRSKEQIKEETGDVVAINEIGYDLKQLTERSTNPWHSSLNPRLITADELAGIVGNTNWNSLSNKNWFYFDSKTTTKTATSQGASAYAWLFDYTKNCTGYGCNTADSSTNGYWTSSKYADDLNNMWNVFSNGRLSYDNASLVYYGLRPVITVSNSILNIS